MLTKVPRDRLCEYVGQNLGASEWFVVDQSRISSFADVTLDHQFIHIDEAAAGASPFGSTVAHGYLTLSLLIYLSADWMIAPDDASVQINYGIDKLRFINPVKAGKRVRIHGKLLEESERGEGEHLLKFETTMEIEGEQRPAFIAQVLMLFVK